MQVHACISALRFVYPFLFRADEFGTRVAAIERATWVALKQGCVGRFAHSLALHWRNGRSRSSCAWCWTRMDGCSTARRWIQRPDRKASLWGGAA
jgi:hypothetical protein